MVPASEAAGEYSVSVTTNDAAPCWRSLCRDYSWRLVINPEA